MDRYMDWYIDWWWHGNATTRKRIKNYFWGIFVFFRNSRKSLKSSELL